MNAIFFKQMFRDAIEKGFKQGGETFFEELCDTLTESQLSKLIALLSKVLEKKRNTIG